MHIHIRTHMSYAYLIKLYKDIQHISVGATKLRN